MPRFGYDFGGPPPDNNQNDNRSKDHENDEGRPEAQEERLLSELIKGISRDNNIPDYISLYVTHLGIVEATDKIEEFERLVQILTQLEDIGDLSERDLADIRRFFGKARAWTTSEQHEEERAFARMSQMTPEELGEQMARDTERHNRREYVGRAGVVSTEGEMSDEEIERQYNRIRRERRERRLAREARQREESRWGGGEGEPEGRIRTIKCLRKIGNQTMDPVSRFYKLSPIYASPRDDIFRFQQGSDTQRHGRLAINQPDPNAAQELGLGEFRTSDNSISTTKVDWSLGGFGDEASLVPANASTLSENTAARWNSCFDENGIAVEITPATLGAHKEIQPDHPTSPELLFTDTAGGSFGQSEAFNFANRMNILAEEAYPNPREVLNEEQLIENLNASFTPQAEGQPYESQSTMLKMQRMLTIAGYEHSTGEFFRSSPEARPRPRTGYDFFRAVAREGRVLLNSLKEKKLIMAGLTNPARREVSEQNFVSYEHYNFKAYSGLARDLFGHQISKTEGELNSEVFGYIDPEYNFYFPEYENAIAGSNVPHLLLPNFYTYIMASSDSLPEGDPPDFLGAERKSTLKNQAIQQITLGEFSNNILPNLRDGDLSTYLTTYSNAVQGGLTTNLSSQLTNMYSNIGLPADQIDIFDRLNSRAATFPMTIKIGIPTGPIGPIGSMIERTGTSTSMMNLLTNTTGQSETFNFTCNAYEVPVFSEDPFDIERPENQPQASLLGIEVPTVVYDFDDWIQNINATSDNIATLSTNDGKYRVGGERLPAELVTLSDSHYTDNLKLAVEAKAAEQTLDYKTFISRRFEMNSCYSETFMYKLRKFTTGISGEDPILVNEFYFPNTQLSKIIEYVDTQIKYNETYYYELLGYDIVFGSEFRFRTRDYETSAGTWTENTFSSRPLRYSFRVETLPSIKVVEYPIFSDAWHSQNVFETESAGGGVKYPIARIVDRPPVPPNVFASPLKDNYRQVMFNFQPMVDSYVDKYISLDKDDEEQFRQISRTQKIQENYDLKRGEVEFMNEGLQEIKFVEIYRTEKMKESPISKQELYDSFRDKLHKVVSNSSGLDFLDTLEPNKTYYYTFRTIDRHDQASNPAQIYEINLSYSSGVFIPRIKLYNPEDTLVNSRTPSKKMARFIEIKSADIQSQVYDERSEGFELIRSRKGLVEDQEDRVTTNKFLIRLTSKDSGKKISFLISFKER